MQEPIYTFQQILEQTRSSEMELRNYLHSIHCIEMDGYLWRLDIEYVGYVLKLVLLTAEELGVSLDRLDKSQMTEALQLNQVPIPVSEHILCFHSTTTEIQESIQLCELKTCRTLGHKLLAQGLQIDFQTFKKNWKEICPEGMRIDLMYLAGLYMVDEDTRYAIIQYFPKERLSSNPSTRFQELFMARSKWTRKDITPFIDDLAPTLKQLNSMITKFCRESKQGDVIFLTTKHVQF
jgi:hypothetical protein